MAACHANENAIYLRLHSTWAWCNKYQQLRGDGSNEGRNEILPFTRKKFTEILWEGEWLTCDHKIINTPSEPLGHLPPLACARAS